MDSVVKKIIDKSVMCYGISIALFAFMEINPETIDGYYGGVFVVIFFLYYLSYRILLPLREKVRSGEVDLKEDEFKNAIKWHPALLAGFTAFLIIISIRYELF